MAERSHLTFAEYLPRAATGAPARPFARHTRGLSRPRGHRFCLKGQKSPTHSKRSPAGHQGERDRGAERAGGSTTWAQQGPGPWVPSTRHTTRKTRYGIGTDRMDEPGPPRQVPASAAGAKTRRRCEPASQCRAYAFQAGIAAVPRPRKASCPANALPLRAAGGRRGSLPVAARQGTGRAELQEAGRAPRLRAPGDGKPPAWPRRPRHPALHSSRATRTDVCNHLCCHPADGGGGRAASAPGREGRVGGSARCPGRHQASPRRHGFNKRRLGDTRPGRERFWAQFRGFREELTLARNTCFRALLHAPGSEPPGISLRVQRFRDVRSHKQQD